MSNSNHGLPENDALHEEFDSTHPLPDWEDAGEPLRSLCERKNLRIEDLLRVGARLKDAHGTALSFFYENGVKYRSLTDERKWSMYGSTWEPMKILPGRDRTRVVVVEGETDAARMSSEDGPGCDVAVMGGGAEKVYEQYVEAMRPYKTVYLALDGDGAGERGAREWAKQIPNAVRWTAPEPAADWCEVKGKLPKPPAPAQEVPVVVWGQELHDLAYPEVLSYLDNAMLPFAGSMLIHGWKGSYKSWLLFDLALALATGTPWGPFATEEPDVRCLIVQFELPSAYYSERMKMLYDDLPDYAQEKYRNVGTYRPLDKLHVDIRKTQTQDHFLEVFTKNKVEVAMFDPIRRMAGSTSHYEQEWQAGLVDFVNRCNAEGIAVVMSHHDGKTAARTGGGSTLDMSAADAVLGAVDSAVSIALPDGDDWGESQRRNLHYYCRNAATPSTSGFSISDDHIHFHEVPFISGDEAVSDAQAID